MRIISNVELDFVAGGEDQIVTITEHRMTDGEKEAYDNAYRTSYTECMATFPTASAVGIAVGTSVVSAICEKGVAASGKTANAGCGLVADVKRDTEANNGRVDQTMCSYKATKDAAGYWP